MVMNPMGNTKPSPKNLPWAMAVSARQLHVDKIKDPATQLILC